MEEYIIKANLFELEQFAGSRLWEDFEGLAEIATAHINEGLATPGVDERTADFYRGQLHQLNEFLKTPMELLATKLLQLEELQTNETNNKEDEENE